LVDGFTAGKRKIAADKEAKEAEAKAKLKAKASAKKKAAQSVEDEWLNDGQEHNDDKADDDSDDDMGFRMFSASELSKAPVENRPRTDSQSFKPLKVKNLIDFGECDVTDERDEPPRPTPAQAAPEARPQGAMSAASAPAKPAAGSISSFPADSSTPASASGSRGAAEDSSAVVQDLLGQVEHLRQMLSDANEEKNITVAIVQDEVDEKKLIIVDLKKKATEAEAARLSLEQRAAELERKLEQTAPVQRSTSTDSQDWKTFDIPHQSSGAPDAGSQERQAELERKLAQQAEEAATDRARLEQQVRDNLVEAASARAGLEQRCAELEREVVEAKAELARLREAPPSTSQPLAAAAPVADAALQELQLLRTEVEQLRASKATAAALPGPSSQAVAPLWLPAAAVLISELYGLSRQTCQTLAEDAPNAEGVQEAGNLGEVESDPEAALGRLREVCVAAQSAARRNGEERRRLIGELSDAKSAAVAAMTAAIPSPVLRPGPTAPLEAAPQVQAMAAGPSQQEAQDAVQAVSNQAAQALREVRLNAERQLAWITKRIKLSGQAGNGVDPNLRGGK